MFSVSSIQRYYKLRGTFPWSTGVKEGSDLRDGGVPTNQRMCYAYGKFT
jgi:hypothetical protein